jgi:hypothetical protein
MLGLPFELQEQIHDHLDRQDLLSLALSCKSLTFVASARLRATIPELDSSAFARCIHILSTDSVRAAEVLEINITQYQSIDIEEPPAPFRPPPQGPPFIKTLKATISKLRSPPTNLVERGTLPCGSPRNTRLGSLDFAEAFTNLTRLRKLVIHQPQNPLLWVNPVVVVNLREIYVHTGAESTPLLGWISYQTHITTLRVHSRGNRMRSYRVSPPDSIFFPSLSTLSTDPEGVSEVLPESVVEDLHIGGERWIRLFPWTTEAIERVQGSLIIRMISESCKRTALRRLTLTGSTACIFGCLKALAGVGVLLSHIRIVLHYATTRSDQLLVRSKA